MTCDGSSLQVQRLKNILTFSVSYDVYDKTNSQAGTETPKTPKQLPIANTRCGMSHLKHQQCLRLQEYL